MKNNNTEVYYTPIQLKLPVDFEKIIEIDDPVYTFNEVIEGVILELGLISCGYNLHKFHLKRLPAQLAA